MASPTSDIAVVGAGILGLATAFELQRRGATVTVYETGQPGQGQSAGQSRIFRHAHADPRLVDYAVTARGIWREWGELLDHELIAPDGALAIGPKVADHYALLDEHPGVDARLVDGDELRERLPVLSEYDGPAMLDATGGSIATQAAIALLSAGLGDALVHDHVLSVRQLGPQDVEVRTGTHLRHHDAVVVCAGRGTLALARGLGLSLPVESGAHVRVSFRPRGHVNSLATLQDSSGVFGEAGVYAAAAEDRSRYGVGLAADVPVGEDGTMFAPEGLAEHVQRVVAYVGRALPGLDPEPLDYVHCWVTRLPWGDDGVAVWTADDVTFIAGHNLFKHAPALGRDLASTVLDGSVPALLRPESRLGEAAAS
ncbi:FAD-binding oxidoreductase [Aeromicrobium phragmitis]|uniref:FAD-binding oxidoreductase n=1 Tax=Aeromicrobium phragmitis TaxID=2478914 RepID=A0A3L8PM90_9ACTN|nr:FAD-binding oxidoreductase [Aeromicrobium phragmitis]RLV56344.1 FAD-binding oxidoreductase [Aeromicrobium phragmitis]